MGNNQATKKQVFQVGPANLLPLTNNESLDMHEIIKNTDNFIIGRKDFVGKSSFDMKAFYIPIKPSFYLEENNQTSVWVKKEELDIKRHIISYPYEVSLTYHEIRKLLDHPYIMKPFEYYQTEDNTFVVLENYEGGDLFDYFSGKKRLKESQVANFARQILLALNYLHQNQICLRNLSPENIVFVHKEDEKSFLKIIGFSKATFKKPGQILTERIGVPYYTSPDVLKGRYGFECDLWSVGIILYTLIAGYPPFWASDDEDLVGQILESKIDFDKPEWEFISNGPKDLIKELLNRDFVFRLTAQEALKHNWVRMYRPCPSKIEIAHSYTNLRTFSPSNKLQEIIWFFIVDSILDENVKNRLALLFEYYDLACDGKISKEELLMFYEEEVVDLIFKKVDINSSGYLEYSEFCMGALNRREFLTDSLKEKCFRMLDLNKDGILGAEDLKSVFQNSEHKKVTESVWIELIKSGDIDNDSVLSKNDFKILMEDFP